MKELVAQRIPPGDRWVLLEEENDVVYGSLSFSVCCFESVSYDSFSAGDGPPISFATS